MKNYKRFSLNIIYLLIAISANSQSYQLPTPNAENYTDMVVYDRLGDTHFLNDLYFKRPGPGEVSLLTTCNAGIFRLYFADAGTGLGFDDPILGPQRQAIACQVYTELSQLLNEANSPYTSISNLGTGSSFVEINVQTSLNSSANPALGSAGQYFLPSSPGIVHGSVWQTINTGIDGWFGLGPGNLGYYGIFHGEMQINFGHPFYLGANPALIPATDYDLYTVILHEAMHALGIGSLINQVGNSKITGTNPGIFSIYDTYLTDNATTNALINWNGCYIASTAIVPLSSLTTPCSIKFNGTSSTFVSSDSPWSNGTSLSHYPIGACGNAGNYVMNPSIAPGVTRRAPDIEEVTTLCDIGYSTSGVYASVIYPAIGVCGNIVSGTNDFATYTTAAPGTLYQTPMNTAFAFSSTDILGNDENSTFYDCLEVVNASGTLTGPLSGGTGSTITFTPNTGFSGVGILRYIPRLNSTGKRGNITYIFITVNPPPLVPCTPSLCEMVCYGGFEEFISQLQYDNYTINGFVNPFSDFNFTIPAHDNSPDLNPTFIPIAFSCGGTASFPTANTGTNFIGMVLRSDAMGNNAPEGPSFPLNSPLNNLETATITLWARLGNALCNGGMEVRFTNFQPCGGNTALSLCPGLIVSTPIASAPLVNNTLWQQLTFVYTNTTGVPLTHLLINSLTFTTYTGIPIGYILLDDVSCIKNTPNLTVTKTGPSVACPNDIIPYTITVCNTSTFPANAVQITDVLSSGLTLAAGGTFTYPTETIPLLAPGACQSFTLNALVNVTAGSVSNTADVSSGGCLVNATTNTVTTTISQPTLNITQTVSNTSPVGGNPINLTVDICNYTNAAVTGINVETTIPAGYTISPGAGYTVSAGLITFNTFNLPAGTSTTPACSTFVIPLIVACSGSGNICTTILSGGNICISQNNCTTINITPLTINVSPSSSIIVSGGSVTLTASGASTYTWLPTAGLSCTSCAITVASPTVTTTYTVTGTINGCTATTTVTITVTPFCGCILSLDALASGGILSLSPAQYNVYCLDNNITISGTVTIALSEIRIAPNVTIAVSPGSTLNIYGSHLYSCSDMWQGIVVKPGGRINVISYGAVLPGLGLTKRSPLIEDARNAIVIQSGSTLTTGILNINNATFNRNEYSTKINGYVLTLPSYPFSIENSVFTCRDIPFVPFSIDWPLTNTVKATYTVPTPLQTPYINSSTFSESNAASYLKPPFIPFPSTLASKSQVAIALNDVGAVAFIGATPSAWYEIKIGTNGVPRFNVFDNHVICIDAVNSNFTCVNNVFQNTIGTNNGGGIAVNATAKDFNFRARVIAGTPTGLFNNKFFDCNRGINSSNYFENIFKFCDVRSTQFASMSNQRGKDGFFVITNRFRVIDMSDNKFYNIENAVTFNAIFGAYNINGVFLSPPLGGQYSGQVNVDRNEIAPHLPTYTIVSEFVRSAIVLGNSIASTIQVIPGNTVTSSSNNISKVHKGILTTSWFRKNIITNSNIITLVTDPFSGTAVQYGVQHTNNSGATTYGSSINGNSVTGTGIFTNSNVRGIYTARCNDERVACNFVNGTTHGIQFASGHLNTKFDNNSMTNHMYGYVLSNNGIIGIQGSLSSPADNAWSGAWTGFNFKTATLSFSSAQFSKMYVRNGGLFNPNGSGFTSTTYGTDDYFNPGTLLYVPTTTPPSLGCAIIVGGGGGGGMPGSAIALLEDIAQDNISHANNDAETKYINKNQLYRLLKADPSLTSSSVVLQNFYIASIPTVRETFANIEDDIASGDLVNGQSKTNALAPVNLIEDNYKTFFNAYLKYQTDTILSGDSIAIVNMANACPFTDGDVVYQARVLYNSIYRTNIYFEDNCPEVSERNFNQVKNTTTSAFDVLLYPNPNTGDFSLVPFISDIKELNIRVIDVNGRIVYEKTIDSGDRIFNFNLDSPNGIYMVVVSNPVTNENIVKRIVIQK